MQQASVNRQGNRTHRSEQLNDIENEMERIYTRNSGEGEDSLLWRHGPNKFLPHFSTKHTWEQLRARRQKVRWSRGIWFKQAIPKHAFLTWVASHNRLSTLDRILSWNPNINPICKLCSSLPESRDHIFFYCFFARKVWSALSSRLLGNHFSTSWPVLLQLLTSTVLNPETQLLFRMVFQSSIYFIWRERNKRNHGNVKSPPRSLVTETEKMIRNKIRALQDIDNHNLDVILHLWNNTRG